MSVYFLKTLHTNLIFKFIKLEENNKPFNLKSTPQSYKKNKKNKNIEEKYYLHELLKKIFLASKSEKRKCVHQKKGARRPLQLVHFCNESGQGQI